MKRTLASAVAAVAAVAVSVPASAQEPTPDRVRVVHLVVDALHPSQVGPLTPVLAGLKASGTWYEQSRAVMASETLPNHVAMATGTYPDQNGIPGNAGRVAVGDQTVAEPDLGAPELLGVASVTRTIETVCPDLETITVFSKAYVHRIFAEDGADADFPQAQFNIPKSGHAPDATTVAYLQDELGARDPDYVFANLGDVDRAGHIDATGATGVPSAQLVALEQTDELIGVVVDTLKDQGLWESTVLIVNSDHSMDWSAVAGASVDVAGALELDPRTTGRFFVAENGGAGLVYLRDPAAPDADEVLAAARELIVALPGIDEALYREPNPLDPGNDLASVHPAWRLGTPRAGEIFVTARDGHSVRAADGEPIPGNHGHAVTRHSTMLVTGGWDGLAAPASVTADPALVDTERFDDTEALPGQSENVDIAPTVGWLLGVPDPALADGERDPQWQGRVLDEAFARQPAPVCVASSGAGPESTPDPEPTGAPIGLPATGGGLAVAAVAVLGALGLRGRSRSRH